MCIHALVARKVDMYGVDMSRGEQRERDVFLGQNDSISLFSTALTLRTVLSP